MYGRQIRVVLDVGRPEKGEQVNLACNGMVEIIKSKIEGSVLGTRNLFGVKIVNVLDNVWSFRFPGREEGGQEGH